MNRTQKQFFLNRAASKSKFLSVSVAVFCIPSITNAAVSYLNNLNPGNPVENTAISVSFPAKVAIGFDIVTPQDGSWNFTIRIFNEAPGAFFADEPHTTSPAGFSALTLFSSTETSPDLFTVVFSGTGPLTAGRYWLVGSTTGSGNGWDWMNGNSSYDVNGGNPNHGNYFAARLATGGEEWNAGSTTTFLSLGIDVTPVPEPSRVLLNQPIFVGSQIQLSFSTMTGKTYYLQSNTNLVSTNWSNVQTNAGDGSTMTNLVTPTDPQGYYRLLRN